MLDILAINNIKYLAGVDEVGRGSLAGPVVAAAVILDPFAPIDGIDDSKNIAHKKRVIIANEIKNKALAWSLGRVEALEIDKINIHQASLLAMKIAIESLKIKPEYVIVDGKYVPNIPYECQAFIKGDSYLPAISAASIIAKVSRDKEMEEYDNIYSGYAFSSNKGYPTKQHIYSLKTLGITKIHRRSYAPVARYIA